MWTCMSMKPGSSVYFERSWVTAPFDLPTDTILPSRMVTTTFCWVPPRPSSSVPARMVIVCGVCAVARAASTRTSNSGTKARSMPPILSHVEYALDCEHQPLELVPLGGEPLLAGGGQRVEARAAIVLGGAPFRCDPAVQQQALQGRVEGTLTDLQHLLRDDLEALGNAVAVQRARDERTQDQQVERAGQQVRRLIRQRHGLG